MNKVFTLLGCIISLVSFGQIVTPEVNVQTTTNNFTGLGVTIPQYPFHLSGDGGTSEPLATMYINSTLNHGGIVLNSPLGKQSHIRFMEGGSLKWQLRVANQMTPDFRLYNWGTASDIMTWQYSSGFVGIGTTNPKGLLHLMPVSKEALVIGTGVPEATPRINAITFTNPNAGAGDNGIRWLDGNGTLKGYVYGQGSAGFTLGSSTGDVNIWTNNQNRMIVSSAGTVSIGTTTINANTRLDIYEPGTNKNGVVLTMASATNSPTHPRGFILSNKDQSAGSWSGFRMVMADNGGTTHSSAWITTGKEQLWTTTASTQDAYLAFATAINGNPPDERMRIKANGNVGVGYTNPSYKLDVNGTIRGSNVSPSDRRLKKNIGQLSSENLELIQGRQYNLKEDGSFHFGVIAQEVERIFPHMVSTDAQGMKSVAYTEFIPLLIEAYKNLQKELSEKNKSFEDLNAEVSAMKTQNEDLNERLKQLEKILINAKK